MFLDVNVMDLTLDDIVVNSNSISDNEGITKQTQTEQI